MLIQVIGAATQCALSTSQLVACAKVVAPTISDPLCQEQLMEAAKEVAKSVEGCVSTCKDVSRDEPSLRELRSSAQDVTRGKQIFSIYFKFCLQFIFFVHIYIQIVNISLFIFSKFVYI